MLSKTDKISGPSMMQAQAITSCYIGPQISPEQFIAEHFFLYLINGKITGYDGHLDYALQAGEYCIARKNHLARYNKQKENGEFGKVVVIFDAGFLKKFQERHHISPERSDYQGAFVPGGHHDMVEMFVAGLAPYYANGRTLDERFADLKREELLMILLHINPELNNILFDFGIPQKIDLQAFMNKNYKFNVGMERFAYLTGRSLSAFKRDFQKIFNDTPSHWLVRRRLEEGHFLINKKGQRPSDIYLDLGFEDLSHFSFAFKKLFGVAPASLIKPPSRRRN